MEHTVPCEGRFVALTYRQPPVVSEDQRRTAVLPRVRQLVVAVCGSDDDIIDECFHPQRPVRREPECAPEDVTSPAEWTVRDRPDLTARCRGDHGQDASVHEPGETSCPVTEHSLGFAVRHVHLCEDPATARHPWQ